MSSERYSELADAAQEASQRSNQLAIDKVRALATEAVPPDFDGKHCFDCADDVEPGRLALGKFRCLACQEVKERNSKLRRA
jgi:hypothetical protein